MIIYAEPGGRVRADYWDNEGHFIHYTAAADGKTATFLSDKVANEQLTYKVTGENAVTVRFEIALPDKPGQFRVYVEAVTRREWALARWQECPRFILSGMSPVRTR